MKDDGTTIEVTQSEYYMLLGKIHAAFLDHGGVWDFPWKGPRSVLIVADPPAAYVEKE